MTLFASLKSEPSFFSSPASFPIHLYFANYSQAWTQGDLLPAFGNSVLVTVVSVLVSGLVGAMAAYAVGAPAHPAHRPCIQTYFLLGLVVPGVVILIPVFVLLHELRPGRDHRVDHPALLRSHLPLSFLIFVNFFRTVPVRDRRGCSTSTVARTSAPSGAIEMPLVRPAIATVAILNGVFVWNDFLLPS